MPLPWMTLCRFKADGSRMPGITYETKIAWCGHCKKLFAPDPKNWYKQLKGLRPTLYCSMVCARKGNAEKRRKPDYERAGSFAVAYCKRCGKARKSPAVRPSTCCNLKCRNHRAKQAYRKRVAGTKERELWNCFQCGRKFKQWSGGNQSPYCSSVCKHNSPMMKAKRRKRRREEKSRSADVPFQVRLYIYERDGWRCQLCGKKVDKSKMGTSHKKAPSIDHILPKSKGGSDDTSNLQCAHVSCNSKKSVKMGGQRRLW